MPDQPTEPSTAIAVIGQPEPGTAIRTISDWEDRSRAIRTSIDTSDDDGRIKYIAALAGKDGDLQDLPGKDEVIEDWLCHVREYADPDTGEVGQALRLALLTRSGKVYSGGSRSLIDAWAALVQIFPRDRRFPPIRLHITKVPRPAGKGHYLRLDRVTLADAPNGKQK